MNNNEPTKSQMINFSILEQLNELQGKGEPMIIVEIINIFLKTSPERVESAI